MKQCNQCLETKTDDSFYVFRPKGKSPYLDSKCKPCKLMQRKNPEVLARRTLRRTKLDTLTRMEVFELKKAPCVDCGKSYHPCVMDYDHVVPDKVNGLAKMVGRYSRQALLEEIAKCELVCSNCHRMRTWNRRKGESAWSYDPIEMEEPDA
jgi:hypothetical protein